jgi:hypothetical protein
MSDSLEYLGLLTVLERPGLPGHGARPNPTPLALLVQLGEVEKHRRLRCRHYGRCLDAALLRAWRSWTCRACGLAAPGTDPALDIDHAGALRPHAGEVESLGRRRTTTPTPSGAAVGSSRPGAPAHQGP